MAPYVGACLRTCTCPVCPQDPMLLHPSRQAVAHPFGKSPSLIIT